MAAGLCVCVLLAVLCAGCLGRPNSSPSTGGETLPALRPPPPDARRHADAHVLEDLLLRQSRSSSSSGPAQTKLLPLSEERDDPRADLSQLLARLISSRKARLISSRKGSVRRNSTVNSRASGLSANHRIKDRDYLGWMDFGRRSAEEYEYSS